MPKVFISHASADRDFVERDLIPLLHAHGIDVWYSPESIQTADQWERSIRQGLESCDWFLLAMSPRSANSEWVRTEVFWAFKKRRGHIVPVIFQTCDPTDFHLMLFEIQAVDFRRDREDAAKKLISAFRSSADRTNRHSHNTDGPLAPSQNAQEAAGSSPLPPEASFLFDTAQAFYARKDYARAIKAASDAIEVYPSYEAAHMLRGMASLHASAFDEAISDLTCVIRINPNSSLALEKRGLAHQLNGDLELSLKDLTHAIQLEPHGSTYFVRGLTYNLRKEFEKAIPDFSEALHEDPTNYVAYMKRAVAYWRLGRNDEALKDATEAIRICPEDGEGFMIRAGAYHSGGASEKAIVDATEAIRLSPNDTMFLMNRGHIYRAMGQPHRARADFDAAVKLDPSLASQVPVLQGNIFRIDEAFKSAQLVGAIVKMDQLSALERARTMMMLTKSGGFAKVLEDLEYLLVNLPSDDPRSPGLRIMHDMVRKIVANNPGS